jgi:hypothetical protein
VGGIALAFFPSTTMVPFFDICGRTAARIQPTKFQEGCGLGSANVFTLAWATGWPLNDKSLVGVSFGTRVVKQNQEADRAVPVFGLWTCAAL